MSKDNNAPLIVSSDVTTKQRVDYLRTLKASVCVAASLSFACSCSLMPIHVDRTNTCGHLLFSPSPTSSLMYDNGSISVFSTSVEGVAVMDYSVEKSFRVLAEIGSLKDNWNNNCAKAFSNQLIMRVRELLPSFSTQPDIFPTAQDSIQLEWENENGDYLEIELFEDHSCSMFYQSNTGHHDISPISYTKIGERVNEFFAVNA